MDYYETTYYILNVVILKMCTWVFDGARINFDRFTASKRSHFLAAYSHCRVWSLLINYFNNFQWVFLKRCRHMLGILVIRL